VRLSFLQFSIFLLALASGLSCRHVPKKGKVDEKPDLLKELELYQFKSDSCWSSMMVSDNNKISNLDRLLKELKLIEGSNEKSLQEIEPHIRSLKQNRYDRISMGMGNQIDHYDSLTNSAIAKIRKAASENPNAIRYQIVNQLLTEIQTADDSVLFYRKEYDRTIDRYNEFLKTQEAGLRKTFDRFDTLRRYPVFRLIP
jgi:hypothetical protein